MRQIDALGRSCWCSHHQGGWWHRDQYEWYHIYFQNKIDQTFLHVSHSYNFVPQLGGEFDLMLPNLIAATNDKLASELVTLIKHADLKTHQKKLLLQTSTAK